MFVHRQAEQYYSKLRTEVNVSYFAHTLYLFNAILIINRNYFTKQENQVAVYNRVACVFCKVQTGF